MTPSNPMDNEQNNGDVPSSPVPAIKPCGFMRLPIMYVRADRSPLRQGGVNTATASLNTTGVKAFKAEVFRIIVDTLQQRQSASPPLESLNPSEALCRSSDVVSASSSLAKPVASEAELQLRTKELMALVKGHPSSHESSIRSACEHEIDECFNQVITPITSIERDHPLAFLKISGAVRECCDRITYPDESMDGMGVLARIQHLLESLTNDPTCHPQHKHDVTRRGALAAAQEACKQQLKTICSSYVTGHFRKRVRELRKRCQYWEKQAAECAAHLDDVQMLLDADLKNSKKQVSQETAEGRLILAGMSKAAVLKELCATHECSGADLVEQLSRLYASQLRERVVDELPEDAGALEVFRVASPADGANVLRELVDERLKNASLYVAIAKYGIGTFVEELVAAAAPLVHLSRCNVLNNIEPSCRSILTVPSTIVAGDQETLKRLKAAAQESITALEADSVEVRISPSVGQTCHLTRTIMGYPAAALAENHCLASAYVESRKFNHCCHLFGALPDCADGMASEIVVDLIENSELEADRNGCKHEDNESNER